MRIKKYSLVDQVYEKLRADIISLQLPLGSKINVNELQAELSVSCTPIREALNRLQQEGLVEYENKVGAHVIALHAHDVVEIQQLAITLHCAAIELAMQNGELSKIVGELKQYLAAYESASGEEAEVQAVSNFFGVYYHNCGNRRLDDSMLSIQSQHLLLRYLYASFSSRDSYSVRLFGQMVEHTAQQDAPAVCQALKDYTNQMTDVLLMHIV